jgi:hypothetical protein
MKLAGSCLCGRVRFEISGPLETPANCHCSMCRKWHGSAFATAAEVVQGGLHFITGEKLVARYESSPGVQRCFCNKCGSSLMSVSKDASGSRTFVYLGSLEGDPGVLPASHLFVGSKAPWFEINDALPQFDAFPLPS